MLSHDAAASLWRFRTEAPGDIDVSVASRDPGRKPGIRIHGVGSFDLRDLRRHRGLPLTAPARTLLDLADVISRQELERAFEDAQIRRVMRCQELLAVLDRSPGRHGHAALRSLLDLGVITRSEAEQRLLRLLRASDLAPTHVNARIGPYEVDMVWHPQRVIVEMDGFAYHSTRAAFERDWRRDAELQAAGYRVIRVTWRQLEEDGAAVIRRLEQVLER